MLVKMAPFNPLTNPSILFEDANLTQNTMSGASPSATNTVINSAHKPLAPRGNIVTF